jgi:hypothetical protein
MSIDRTRTIEILSGLAFANGSPTKVSPDRNTVQHTPSAGLRDADTGGTESAGVPANLYLPSRWSWGPRKSSIDWY